MLYRLLFVSLAIILLLASGAVGKEGAKMSTFSIKSTAFKDNTSIPKQYTCDGKDINPPLVIRNVPNGGQAIYAPGHDDKAGRGV